MMMTLRRLLLADEGDYAGVFNCTMLPDCDPFTDPVCFKCSNYYYDTPFTSLLPPPPPPIHQTSSSTNHVIPYIISAVCAVGVAFLILTTCTILLRQRWARQRRNNNNNNSRDTTTREVVFVDELDRLHGGIVDHPIWHINTIGLQQSLIDQITSFKYKKCDGLLTEGSDCSVCLAEFQEGEELRLLPKCSHAFHLDCIDTWLRSHKNCPLCRAPVVPLNISDSNSSRVVSFGLVSQSSGEQISSSRSTLGENSELDSLGGSGIENQNIQGEGGETRADDFGHLPIEGVRIAEIMKRNRANGVLSDLGDNYRLPADCQQLQPVRRSVSLDVEAASVLSNSIVIGIPSLQNGEGSSKQQLDKIQGEKEKGLKKWHCNSFRLMKSSSIGRSLQKAPVSMKRSLSSGGKIFSSFRGSSSSSSTKIQAISSLPV